MRGSHEGLIAHSLQQAYGQRMNNLRRFSRRTVNIFSKFCTLAARNSHLSFGVRFLMLTPSSLSTYVSRV